MIILEFLRKIPGLEQIENKAAYIVKLIYHYNNILLYLYK
jgi:hypothetical protein